jgi:hypothetical protein
MADTAYCSFCGKSQFDVKRLVAGPAVFICDECIAMCVATEGGPDPEEKRRREVKLEELKALREDIGRLRATLTRLEERVHEPPFWMTEEIS